MNSNSEIFVKAGTKTSIGFQYATKCVDYWTEILERVKADTNMYREVKAYMEIKATAMVDEWNRVRQMLCPDHSMVEIRNGEGQYGKYACKTCGAIEWIKKEE